MSRDISELSPEEFSQLEKSLAFGSPTTVYSKSEQRQNDLIECALAASNGDEEAASLLHKALRDNDEVFVQVVTEVRGIQTAYQKSLDTGEPLALPERHHSTRQPRETGTARFRRSLIQRHGGNSLFR